MWIPVLIWLSRSQLLKCCASAIAASAGFRLYAHCGQALVPAGLSLSRAMAQSCAALRNGALAKSAAFSKARRAVVLPPRAGSGARAHVYSLPLIALGAACFQRHLCACFLYYF